MARMLRCEFEGAMYHVMARGIERRAIFRDDADHNRFLEKLQESLVRYHVSIHAFALMSNHYHLLLMTPRGNLSQFMHQFVTSYTMYFNTRHHRTGPLFSGRYKSPLVEGDRYLLKLVRYIHLNPAGVRSVKVLPNTERWAHLRRYRWSSHRSYGGWGPRLDWVEHAPVDEVVSELVGEKAKSAYRKYLRAGLADTDAELEDATRPKAVGSEGFQLWVQDLYQRLVECQGVKADVSMRRMEAAIDPGLVHQEVSRQVGLMERGWEVRHGQHRLEKDLLIEAWSEWSGLRGRDIGLRLGHGDGSIVSRRMRTIREERRKQKPYRRCREEVWRELSKVKA